VAPHGLRPLADESVFLGLGDAIHDDGLLGTAGRAALADALSRYAEAARGLGAAAITFVGTEPLRRAADGARVVAEVEGASGVPVHVLTHEEEAYLTLVGVLEGRAVTRETLVVDIGGGSSEFVFVGPDRAPRGWGLRLGAARLTGAHVEGDPPIPAEVEAMRRHVEEALREAPDAAADDVIAVGGTASNLVKVLPDAQLDRILTRDRIGGILGILGTEPAALAAERHGVNPIRARLLPAGAVILEAVLSRFDAEVVRVADVGIREGTVLAVAHAGPSWRDRLPELARGWRRD
jgi:exopolyphosphatase/guanosine-5'-triphosphate,3'-diphosphate pyrophosphatase